MAIIKCHHIFYIQVLLGWGACTTTSESLPPTPASHEYQLGALTWKVPAQGNKNWKVLERSDSHILISTASISSPYEFETVMTSTPQAPEIPQPVFYEVMAESFLVEAQTFDQMDRYHYITTTVEPRTINEATCSLSFAKYLDKDLAPPAGKPVFTEVYNLVCPSFKGNVLTEISYLQQYVADNRNPEFRDEALKLFDSVSVHPY